MSTLLISGPYYRKEIHPLQSLSFIYILVTLEFIMPKTSPVVLILGAGPNIGQHVAKAFASKGYKVALAARRLKESDSTADQVSIPSDFADPNGIAGVFSKVKASLGDPSVVIYNGEKRTPLPPSPFGQGKSELS